MSSPANPSVPEAPRPDDDRERTGPDDPASKAIVASLRTAIERIQIADPAARGGEPEGVHRLRTSARRLRSELQAFGKLLDAEWRDHLAAELRWLGGAIGEVRDLDVLRERFEKGESEADRLALKPLFDWLEGRRTKGGRTMRRTLTGERFKKLLAELEKAADDPPVGERAGKPCRKILPPLVVKAWKRLRSDADGLAADSPDVAFHEIRKRAKRARYTTELVASALGPKPEKRARRIINLARKIQDVLGEHQDAVVALTEVETFVALGRQDEAFHESVEGLLARLRRAADESRDLFLDELAPKLAKKKNQGRLENHD
ncbi:CHAD domain-containing protein [Paludisphaera mucosa]|uniref:CHAD domain-containing protein n=1 Tax=Paludisphaera mucosa TaxID=3030827 RepID=A0ABT6F855_9BACT|nr:CHAD domain-containing protein [Paludisphaera mucosa]MDG3003773.1 CHAD domain-containing protein [Paludisphaera mucosa]